MTSPAMRSQWRLATVTFAAAVVLRLACARPVTTRLVARESWQ